MRISPPADSAVDLLRQVRGTPIAFSDIMKKRNGKISGFSVLNALVAMVLGSTMIAATSTLMAFAQRHQAITNAQHGVQSIVQEITMLMNTPESCLVYLQGLTFNHSELATQKISDIKIFAPKNPTNIIASRGSIVTSNTSISDISLADFIEQTPSIYLARLSVETRSSNSLQLSPRSLPIKLLVEMGASPEERRIIGCSTSKLEPVPRGMSIPGSDINSPNVLQVKAPMVRIETGANACGNLDVQQHPDDPPAWWKAEVSCPLGYSMVTATANCYGNPLTPVGGVVDSAVPVDAKTWAISCCSYTPRSVTAGTKSPEIALGICVKQS